MGIYADIIVPLAERAQSYARDLQEGVTAAIAARQPLLDGRRVNCNHAAWCYGHLAMYPARVFSFLGQAPPAEVVAPAEWAALFDPTSVCWDDAEGTLYPPFEAITEAFFRGYARAIGAVGSAEDSALGRPLTDARLGPVFGRIGVAVLSLLTQHVALHMGQVSTWRRCHGLGSAR